ncbi:MAG: hypothetical protein IJ509_00355 [Bacilli bacterium]|nr:hypothetical protein [Bacilli bacterium]
MNNEFVKKDNDSKKIFTLMILIFTLMICTTSATYAYFALTATNNVATGTAATASLTLTVTEAALGGTASGGTQTGKMVPQNIEALGTAMGTNYKCVDGNGNIVCKAYTVTVTNGSSAAVRVIGTIQFSGNDGTPGMPNLSFRRTTSVTALGNYTTSSVGKSTELWDVVTTGSTCTVGTAAAPGTCTVVNLVAGASTTYYIVVWIEETGTTQTDSGTWRGTITFQGENGTGVTSTITA